MKHLLESRYDRLTRPVKECMAGPFTPFPQAGDRKAWEAVSPRLRAFWVKEAESLLGFSWPALPASEYLRFKRNGNRLDYESLYFRRRGAVARLALAECLEGRGRFLEDLLNGIWAICEESSWCIPAHLYLSEKQGEAGLPDVDEPLVDLFAADTGALLAWVAYLLGEQLDGSGIRITGRIKSEVSRRVLEPYLARDDFWWIGFTGREPNNWNPWCNSNCLTAALLLEENPERKLRFIHKAVSSLDRYLAVQYGDGGCDEGAQYWGVAGGSLFDCLELLHLSSGGGFAVYDEPLVGKLGQYIVKVFIDQDYFVNFADGAARVAVDHALIYRYGKRIGDGPMAELGLCGLRRQLHSCEPRGDSQYRIPLFRELAGLFLISGLEEAAGLAEADAKPLMYLREAWLPAIQVLTAREREGSARGLHLAVKGGHNDESHNHNDIGHLSVALDGIPILVDAGVGTYTAQTFSAERYEIWTMQSGFHNVPVVNGMEQRAGRNFQARVLDSHCTETEAYVELELAAAYPAEARIVSWRRKTALRRNGTACIELTDKYELGQVTGATSWTFISSAAPVLDGGQVLLRHDSSGKALLLAYDETLLHASFETILLDDPRLIAVWGPQLYRLQFTDQAGGRKGAVSFRISECG